MGYRLTTLHFRQEGRDNDRAQLVKEAEEGEDLIAIHNRTADNGASMQMKRNAIMIDDVQYQYMLML